MLYALFTILLLSSAHAWTGILIDGPAGTQTYTPDGADASQNMSVCLPHFKSSTALMFHDRVMFLGGAQCGKTNNCAPTNTAIRYDAATNTSSSGVMLSTPRMGHASVVVNNSIIVCGGCPTTTLAMRSCEQYSPAKEQWTS